MIFISNNQVLTTTEQDATPNLDAVRYELGKEGKEGSKAVWENTGLIPKFYKPYSLIETTEKNNPAPIYRCNFCKLIYKGVWFFFRSTYVLIKAKKTI